MTGPMMAPTIRIEALAHTGRRHARQLAVTMTLLSERPADAIPNSPTIVAIQRELSDWDRPSRSGQPNRR